MEVYASEQEQIEAFKKWWKENGTALIVGAVIGLGGLFGWQFWHKYKDRRGAAASSRYEVVLGDVQSGKTDQAIAEGKALIERYDATPYAALAALTLAKIYVDKGEAGAAEQQLRWVLDHGHSAEVKNVARLRLGRLLLNGGKLAAVRTLLKGVDYGAFAGSYEELLGDLAVAAGEPAKAREAYLKALSANPASAPIVRLKLDDLGSANGANAAVQ